MKLKASLKTPRAKLAMGSLLGCVVFFSMQAIAGPAESSVSWYDACLPRNLLYALKDTAQADLLAESLKSEHRYQDAIWVLRGAGLHERSASLESQLLSAIEEAPAVSDRILGEGVSGAREIILEDRRLGRLRAVFKPDPTYTIYNAMLNPIEFMMFQTRKNLSLLAAGGDFENRIDPDESLFLATQQNYTHELAAYHLDRLLGLNLVPVTVKRRINGVPGSLQYWVESAVPAVVKSQETGKQVLLDPTLFEGQESPLRNTLDYLLANIDRDHNLQNHKIIMDLDKKLVLFDHGMGFLSSRKQDLRSDRQYSLPTPGSLETLRHLGDKSIIAREFPWLSSQQVKMFDERIKTLVEYFDSKTFVPQ